MGAFFGVLLLVSLLLWIAHFRSNAGRARPAFKERGVAAAPLTQGLVHALISDRGFLRTDTLISSVIENDVAIDRRGACGRLVLHAVEGPNPERDIQEIEASAARIVPRTAATLVLVGGTQEFSRRALARAGSGRTLHVSEDGVVSERGRGFGSAAPRLVLESALDRMAADLESGGLPAIDVETARSLVSPGTHGTLRTAGLRGVATTALTMAIVFCFVIEVLISPDALKGEGAGLSVVYRMGGVHRPSVLEGQWQRLIAAPFLHFGLLHLGMNGWAQWSLGGPIEFLIGPWRFLLLWVLSALGASLTSVAFNDTSVSAGASGAIFGLLGAFSTFIFLRKDILPQPVPRALRNGVLATLLLNLMISFIPSIDMAAHAGGFVTGAIAALFIVRRTQSERKANPFLLRLVVAAVVVVGVGVSSYLEEARSTTTAPPIAAVHHVGDLKLPLPANFSIVETRRGDVVEVEADGRPRSPFFVTYRVSERQEDEGAARDLLPGLRSKPVAEDDASDWIALSRVGVSGRQAVEVIVVAPRSCRPEAEKLSASLARQIKNVQ